MRKGTFPLLLALAALAWLCGPGTSVAASLEPTDSGAPSAIVIFPVGEAPNPNSVGMPPVAYNHLIHEKWMKQAGKDCLVCHHTGDPVACTQCHTVQGKEDAKFVTLYEAMHKPVIRQRNEYTPSSCVSCHDKELRQRQCSGCHTQLVTDARKSDKWCNVCHTITPSMTVADMEKGIENKLGARKNENLASETALARKTTQYWSPMKGPYKVEINTLAGQYEPCLFNHRHHVQSMLKGIENNKLAGNFHTDPATVCVTCHHNSPPSATPPKCVSCHTTTIDWHNPGKPSLMPAFHLLCMNCHKDMSVGRPRNTDCTTCHKQKPVSAGVK